MTSLVVPQEEMDSLVQLCLNHYRFQYGIRINIEDVSSSFIDARSDFNIGVEIISISTDDDFRCRIYVKFTPIEKTELDKFRLEEVENSVEHGTPSKVRVTTAFLPKTQYPALSKIVEEQPQPPASDLTVGFNPMTYNVASSQSINLKIKISDEPDETVSVNYQSHDGTAEAGVDYNALTGTASWASGDGATKMVALQTGQHLYYNWRDIEQLSSESNTALTQSESEDGLSFSIQNNGNNGGYPTIISNNLPNPEVGSPIYYEYELTSSDYKNYYWVMFQLTTPNNEFDYVEVDLGYNDDTQKFDVWFYTSEMGVVYDTILPLSLNIESFPVRIGLLVANNFVAKININGQWIHKDDLTLHTDPDEVPFSVNANYTADSKFNIIHYPELKYNGNPSDHFALEFKTGNDVLYKPANAINYAGYYINTNGGNLSVGLTSPVNADIGNTTANVTISVPNICYTKLVTNDDQTGFGNSTTPNDVVLDYYYGTVSPVINWEDTKNTCGTYVDLCASANGVDNDNLFIDFSQCSIIFPVIKNTPRFPIVDDVRDVIMKHWSSEFFHLSPEEDLESLPFTFSANSDGSFNWQIRFRSYSLPGLDSLIYFPVKIDNDDAKGQPPKLFDITGLFSSYDKTLILQSNSLAYTSDGQILYQSDFENATIYYTTDGSAPTSASTVFNSENTIDISETGPYVVKSFIRVPGWTDSDVTTLTFYSSDGDIGGSLNVPSFETEFNMYEVPVELYNIIVFNTDSLYTDFDQILIQISNPNIEDDPNSTIYYSLDGGLTSMLYTEPFPLPTQWKTPSSHSGYPGILSYAKNEHNQMSNFTQLTCVFQYPNWKINCYSDFVTSVVESTGITVTCNGLDPTAFTSERTRLNNVRSSGTFIDDYRYFELSCITFTDDNSDQHYGFYILMNQFYLYRNGSMQDNLTNSSVSPSTSLAWGEGDTIRIWFNYRLGKLRIAINDGEFCDEIAHYTPAGISPNFDDIGFGLYYYSSDQHSSEGSQFIFRTKASHFLYSLPDANTLALDTSP